MQETKKKILHYIETNKRATTGDLVAKFRISRAQVAFYLKALVQEGEIVKTGSTKASVYMPKGTRIQTQRIILELKNADLKEHEILQRIRSSFSILHEAKENIQSILDFAISEMLNNAIEHSLSKRIQITVETHPETIEFTVRDFGVGVFRNVMKKYKLKNELEAMQDLLKGKSTTAPLAHSGEGIFFTSKMADVFQLTSFKWRLRVDNTIRDIFFEPIERSVKGTSVTFVIDNKSNRHASAVFNQYTSNDDDKTFSKTEILVRLYTSGTIYVSRSQARRILTGLDKFKTIILDFKNVPTIGQAFADEVFRVFKARYPSIKIVPVETNEAVQFMIDHAQR